VSIQHTLPKLLEAVKEAYECIEVRTIAADVNGTIYNVVTLIQFSTSPPDECKENMRKRVAGRDLLADGLLQFKWMCLPATEWPELATRLAAGELYVDGLTASLGAAVDLNSFTSTISDDFGYIKNPTPPYPMFQDSRSTFPESMSRDLAQKLESIRNDDDVRNQLNLSDFEWFRDLATWYLGAINNDPSGPSVVVIVAPVPVILNHIEVILVDHRIRAHVRLHPKLMGSLRLTGHIVEGKRALSFGKLLLVEENQAYAEAEFELTSLDDHVELRLHNKILGIIQKRSFLLRQAVPDGYQYIQGALVPVGLFDAREIPHLPEQARADLSRAMTFLAEGGKDDVAVALACGAVDKVIEAIYKKNDWKDRPKSFQAGVNTVMQKLGIFTEMERELVVCGIDADEASTTAREMAGAINHVAQALQVIRKTQGVAHGSRPTHSRMVYETIKWASAICGLLEGKA
jgi:hypothetical protein